MSIEWMRSHSHGDAVRRPACMRCLFFCPSLMPASSPARRRRPASPACRGGAWQAACDCHSVTVDDSRWLNHRKSFDGSFMQSDSVAHSGTAQDNHDSWSLENITLCATILNSIWNECLRFVEITSRWGQLLIWPHQPAPTHIACRTARLEPSTNFF